MKGELKRTEGEARRRRSRRGRDRERKSERAKLGRLTDRQEEVDVRFSLGRG